MSPVVEFVVLLKLASGSYQSPVSPPGQTIVRTGVAFTSVASFGRSGARAVIVDPKRSGEVKLPGCNDRRSVIAGPAPRPPPVGLGLAGPKPPPAKEPGSVSRKMVATERGTASEKLRLIEPTREAVTCTSGLRPSHSVPPSGAY